MVSLKLLIKETYKFIFQSGLSLLDTFPDSNFGNRLRGFYVAMFVKGDKKGLQICKNVHILYPRNISIGRDSYIGYGTWINAMGGLNICDEVMIGPYVKISTGDHTFKDSSFRFGEHNMAPVSLGTGCWVAASVTITKGTNIGARSVVAAGSVVTKDIEPDGVYGGVPAKKLK